MPVTYQIDKAKRLIRTKCTGATTLEEVLNHFSALEEDPDCPEHLNVLLDLSEQTSMPRRDELQDVAREIGRVQGTFRFGACAIVACTDALFGMLRMFEVFAEQYFRQTYVFRTLQEAEAWLDAQHPKTSSAG